MRWKIGFSLLAVFLCLYAWTKSALDVRVSSRKDASDIRYIPTPNMMRFLSIGYKEFFADLYWIEALNYFGENLIKKTKKQSLMAALKNTKRDQSMDYLIQYADVILALDPYFIYFYEWSSTIFIYSWMQSTKESTDKSNYYGNQGIINLAKIYRYPFPIIEKIAFNLAIETKEYDKAAAYFMFLSRVSSEKRDSALIAGTYYDSIGQSEKAKSAREEYLAYTFLENSSVQKRTEAIVLLSSANVNSGAFEFLRSARIAAEQDADLKALIKRKFEDDKSFSAKIQQAQPLQINPKLQKIFSTPVEKTQILNPSLILLLSL